jgi:aldehyde dehydrogenase (NAD+)
MRSNEQSTAVLTSRSPIDGRALADIPISTPSSCVAAIDAAQAAFLQWRCVPAPRRGELVRQFALAVREAKADLARCIVLEVGKIESEALGEVQEVVDICEFAAGLSRQLQGLTLPSERVRHHLVERWHPLGPVAVITAFNFPMAVWAWNAALAFVCGNSVLWKPSEKTPLCAERLHEIFETVRSRFADAPPALSTLLQGGREVAGILCDSASVALVSATGSTRMGREVGVRVASRFGRVLLELGGNNASIVAPTADEALAVRAVTFAAVGTAGQRCTTLRRLFVHASRYDSFVARLKVVFSALKIGSPQEQGVLIGPLIDSAAYDAMRAALSHAKKQGGLVFGGDRVRIAGCEDGIYVRPAIVEVSEQLAPMLEETFAPILYVMPYQRLDDAIAANNCVRQGLSSSLLTRDLHEAEMFLSVEGSDCGIANINTSTSGAEIGGAFGGEKESGGGREAGSDAWKSYMRRQTQVVNYSSDLPLAQGVVFNAE